MCILDDLQVKLCDFGSSLKANSKGIVEEPVENCGGTLPWSAPETLHGGVISTKSDIFSFGAVLYEMLTLKPPHIDDFNESSDADFPPTDNSMNDSSMFEYSYTEKYGKYICFLCVVIKLHFKIKNNNQFVLNIHN